MEEGRGGDRHLSDTSSVSTLYRIFREQHGGLSGPEQHRSIEAKDRHNVDAKEETSGVGAAASSSGRRVCPKEKAYPFYPTGIVVDGGSRSILRHLARLSELEKEAETTTSTQLERIASRLVRSFVEDHHEGGGAVRASSRGHPCKEGKPQSHQQSSADIPGRNSSQAEETATGRRRSSIRNEDRSYSTKLSILKGRRRGLLVQENEDTEGKVDDGEVKSVEDTALRHQFSTSHRGKSEDGYHTSFCLPSKSGQRETRKTSHHGNHVASQIISHPKEGEDRLSHGTSLFLSRPERVRTSSETTSSAPLSRAFFLGIGDEGVLKEDETCQKGKTLPIEGDLHSKDVSQESLSGGRYGCCFSLSQNSLLEENEGDCSLLDVSFLKKSVINVPTGEKRGGRESVLPATAQERFQDEYKLTRETKEKSFLDPDEDFHRHTDSTRSSSSPLPPSTHFFENESDSKMRERRERRENRSPPLLRTTTTTSTSSRTSQDVENLSRSCLEEGRNLTCKQNTHARDENIPGRSSERSQKNHTVGREDGAVISRAHHRALLLSQGSGKKGEVVRDSGDDFSFSPLDFQVSQHPGVTTQGEIEGTNGEWCGVSHDADSFSLVEENEKEKDTTTHEECSSRKVEATEVMKLRESTCCGVTTTELGGGDTSCFVDHIDSQEDEEHIGNSKTIVGTESATCAPFSEESHATRSKTVTSEMFSVTGMPPSLQCSLGPEGAGRTDSKSLPTTSPARSDSGEGEEMRSSTYRGPVFIELSPLKEASPRHPLRLGAGGVRYGSGRCTPPPVSRIAGTPSRSEKSSPLLKDLSSSVPMIRRQLRRTVTAARQRQRAWPVSSSRQQKRNGTTRNATVVDGCSPSLYCPELELFTFKTALATPVNTPRKRVRADSEGRGVADDVGEKADELQVRSSGSTQGGSSKHRANDSVVNHKGQKGGRGQSRRDEVAGSRYQLGEWLTPRRSAVGKPGRDVAYSVHTVGLIPEGTNQHVMQSGV